MACFLTSVESYRLGVYKVNAVRKMLLGASSVNSTVYWSSTSTLTTPATLAMKAPVRFCASDFSQPQTTSTAVNSLPNGLLTPLRSSMV